MTTLLFLILLIGLNAFFAASEIALISLNDNKIRLMAEEGNKKATLLKNLLGQPTKFLSTIQIGITLAGFLASASAADYYADHLVEFLKLMKLPIAEGILRSFSVGLITLILSYFTLVLGELVPKRLAMKKAESISFFVVRPIHALSVVASPYVKLLTLSTNFIIRLFGIDPNEEDEEVTEEEIRMMVDVGEEKGTIREEEKEMINNIFEFDNKICSDIMTHRTDVIGIPITSTLEDISEIINNEKYTRLPVYENNIDNIIGVLHVKDLIQYVNEKDCSKFDLRKIIRQPYFVPASKRIDELFKDLQLTKTHMVIVIDEYGGTAGIITIEDLLEEIVGNIFDEYDEDEKEIEKLDENTYVIKGTTDLELVGDVLGMELPVEDYDTLSGFVIGQLGRIPSEEEQTLIEYNGMVFKIEAVEEKRVAEVKVCRM